jgi:hypothetical protein
MPDTPEYLAGRLADESLKTHEFFDGLTAEQWDIQVYSDGTQWTLCQILTHFVSSEVSFNRLIENILQGGEGAPEGFDIDVYNEKKVLQLRDSSITEMLERFDNARQRNIELVSQMTADDLLIEGRHPFLGVVPLKDMIKLIYRHNQIHQRDMRKKLG